MYNSTILRDRIKEICKQRGITQKHLCDVLSKAPNFLGNVWVGKDSIDDSELAIIAKELHTTPEYLKGETDTPDAPDKKQIDISDVKVALFGGDKEVTDEMWDEVKSFVEFVIQKHQKGDK